MASENNEVKIGRYICTGFNKATGAIGLKLMEENGNRVLSISACLKEAVLVMNITEPFNKILNPDIPPVLPCDFLKNISDALEYKLLKVVIHDLVGEDYSADLYFLLPDGQNASVGINLDIALSLIARIDIPLYVKENVFKLYNKKKHSRINWYDLHEEQSLDILNRMSPKILASYPIDELNLFIEKVIEKEEYSLAAKIKNALTEKNAAL
jgi:bifunctional DNase/RNase